MLSIPVKIYKDYNKKILDKKSASKLLIELIENSNDEGLRVKCIEYLGKIDIKSLELFKIFREYFDS
jgi:hypothetical protein